MGDAPEADAVCTHGLLILSAETIKIWKFYTIYFLILDQCVSLGWGRAELHSQCLAPLFASLMSYTHSNSELHRFISVQLFHSVTSITLFWQLDITAFNLFTPPTRTRQSCLVWSASAVWTQLETRQDKTILSRPRQRREQAITVPRRSLALAAKTYWVNASTIWNAISDNIINTPLTDERIYN